jgi:hypothetical protein
MTVYFGRKVLHKFLKADVLTWPEMPRVPEKFEQSEEKKMRNTHLTKKSDVSGTYRVLIDPAD